MTLKFTLSGLYRFYNENKTVVPLYSVKLGCRAESQEQLLFFTKHLHKFMHKELPDGAPPWLSFVDKDDYMTAYKRHLNIIDFLKKEKSLNYVLGRLHEGALERVNQLYLDHFPTLLEYNDWYYNVCDMAGVSSRDDTDDLLPEHLKRCRENIKKLYADNQKYNESCVKRLFAYYIYYLLYNPKNYSPLLKIIHIGHLCCMICNLNAEILIDHKRKQTNQLAVDNITLADLYTNLVFITFRSILEFKVDRTALLYFVNLFNLQKDFKKFPEEMVYKKIVTLLKRAPIHSSLIKLLPRLAFKDFKKSICISNHTTALNLYAPLFKIDSLAAQGKNLKRHARDVPQYVVNIFKYFSELDQEGIKYFRSFFPNILLYHHPKYSLLSGMFIMIKTIAVEVNCRNTVLTNAEKVWSSLNDLIEYIEKNSLYNAHFLMKLSYYAQNKNELIKAILHEFNDCRESDSKTASGLFIDTVSPELVVARGR
ncbi:hypothetical protein CCFV1_ORF045 [Cotesia congregata filamentous virus 1]|uniref:Uncharacterized protein n=1 Tax=Cotesia congregata filamentous virus 1 TaxID=3064291 RepID=A0ABC8QR25_9VIRU|nr:hypothetical protein CCFV1_ORF045 [Cotesia congregata filamentous virus 1]